MNKSKNKKPMRVSRFSRLQLGGIVLVALLADYALVSRALDTASWWEYGLSLVIIIFAINRGIAACSPNYIKKK